MSNKEYFQSTACYPGTDILINKFNIKNKEELAIAEKRLTAYNIAKMNLNKIPEKKFVISVDYLFFIHKYIFEEIYPFAGIIRTENVIKGDTIFCPVIYISPSLNKLFKQMKKSIEKVITREELINFLAYFYGELNIIHPFREGNGRTIREFLSQLVKNYNKEHNTYFELDYSIVNEDLRKLLIQGSIENATTTKINLLKVFFEKTLVEKEIKKEMIK